jgi:hypothetical protein
MPTQALDVDADEDFDDSLAGARVGKPASCSRAARSRGAQSRWVCVRVAGTTAKRARTGEPAQVPQLSASLSAAQTFGAFSAQGGQGFSGMSAQMQQQAAQQAAQQQQLMQRQQLSAMKQQMQQQQQAQQAQQAQQQAQQQQQQAQQQSAGGSGGESVLQRIVSLCRKLRMPEAQLQQVMGTLQAHTTQQQLGACMPSHLLPSHPISCHGAGRPIPISSHLISSHPLPSHCSKCKTVSRCYGVGVRVSAPAHRGAAPYGVTKWLSKSAKSLDCLLV